MVDFSQLAFPLFMSTLALGPIIILTRFYLLTKARDCIFFATAFIMIIAQLLIFGISGVSENSVFDQSNGALNQLKFELVQQLYIITGLTGWYVMFLIGKRSRWLDHKIKLQSFISGWFILMILLTLYTRVVTNPESITFLGVKMVSSLPNANQAVLIDLGAGFIYGQGYHLLDILFIMSCALIFAYSIIKMENTFQYTKFSNVKAIWLTLSFSYLMSQLVKLIPIFHPDVNEALSEVIFIIFQIIGGLCYLTMAVWTPEGFLLSKVQVIRMMRYYEKISLSIDLQEKKAFLTNKLVDYILFLEENYDMIEKEIDKSS